MPKYGHKSKKELHTVHEDLQELMAEVIKYCDVSILQGIRTKEKQRELLEQGKTKTLDSKHLNGEALDFAPYPTKWEDRENFIYIGGFIKGMAASMGIGIRYGGDWNNDFNLTNNNFDDLGHIELI